MSSPTLDAAPARSTFQHSRRQPWQLQPPAPALPLPAFSAGYVVNGQFQLHTQLHQGPRSSVWRAVCTATTGAATPASGSLLAGAETETYLPTSQEVVLKFLPAATIGQQQAAQQELASTTAVTAAAGANTQNNPACKHTAPISCLLSSFHLGDPAAAAFRAPAAAAAAAAGDGGCGSSLVLVLAPAHEPLATLLAYQRSRGRAGLPTPAVLQLARCGLQALDLAHRKAGVAHLDVKPANLLLATAFLKPAQRTRPGHQQQVEHKQQEPEEGHRHQHQEQQEQGDQPRSSSHRLGLQQGPGWRTPTAAELATARWVLVDWGSAARLTPTPQPATAAGAVVHGGAGGSSSSNTGSSWWRGATLTAMQQQQQQHRHGHQHQQQLPHLHQAGWLHGAKAADGGVVLGRPGYDTPAYAAPEVLLQGTLTPAADMWSLGATLFEAATGVPLLQLPTRGPALGTLLTWLQRRQQQQQGDSVGLPSAYSWQGDAAPHSAAGASRGNSSSDSSTSSTNSHGVEELVDGAQLALMEALAAGGSSSSSSRSSLFEWPQSLAAGAGAPTWLTATRLLRRPWDRLAADARHQLATAGAGAAAAAAGGGGMASGQPPPVARPGSSGSSSSSKSEVYWGWHWPWQLQQVGGKQRELWEEEQQRQQLPVEPLRVLLQAGRGLRAGPPAAGRQGRKLDYDEAVQLAGLLAPMLALDPTQRPAPGALLQHPALQREEGKPGGHQRPG